MKTPDRWMDFWMTFAHWSWRWLPLLPFLLGGVILLIASLGAQMVGPVFPQFQQDWPEGTRIVILEGVSSEARYWGSDHGTPDFVAIPAYRMSDKRLVEMDGAVLVRVR